MINILQIAHRIEKFAVDNSPLLLTAAGVTGAVTSVILTGKATFEAAAILREMEDTPSGNYEPLSNIEAFKMVWPEYIPAAGTLVLTVAAIIMSHQINTRRAAALAAAYSLSEKAFVEYRAKIVESIGNKKEEVLRGEIAQEKVANNQQGLKEVIISSGEVLCYDAFSGRYFNSTVELIRQAQNDVNQEVLTNMYCSLSDFYSKIGLATTTMSEEVGWNIDTKMDIRFSTVMSNDGRPCISIDFSKTPVRDYYRVW